MLRIEQHFAKKLEKIGNAEKSMEQELEGLGSGQKRGGGSSLNSRKRGQP